MNDFFKPTGRITRRKYWTLFIAFYIVNLLCAMQMYSAYERGETVTFFAFGVVLVLTIIVLIIQSMKRLHDLGMKSYYAFLLLIPPPINLIGFVWLGTKKGHVGENDYGPDPRETDAF